MSLKQAEILGVNVNSLTMVQAVEKVQQFIDERKNALVATANAEMLMRATQDEELKHILNSADLVVPDGAGTVWAANYLGVEMPERVAGYDLAQELMREAPGRGDRIYFFGSAPGVAESAREKAMELYPGIKIVGTRNGFFSEADEPEIIAATTAALPDFAWAALGLPNEEYCLDKTRPALQGPVAIGVGGTLDVMAGVMQRAPLWMQKAKLEWLFRGLKQPSRAGRLLALPKFVMKVMASKK